MEHCETDIFSRGMETSTFTALKIWCSVETDGGKGVGWGEAERTFTVLPRQYFCYLCSISSVAHPLYVFLRSLLTLTDLELPSLKVVDVIDNFNLYTEWWRDQCQTYLLSTSYSLKVKDQPNDMSSQSVSPTMWHTTSLTDQQPTALSAS